MSRKRSRAETNPHGPIPMPGLPPIWGRFPTMLQHRGYLPQGWVTRPLWQTKAARQFLIFLIAAPLAILVIMIVLAIIQAIFSH